MSSVWNLLPWPHWLLNNIEESFIRFWQWWQTTVHKICLWLKERKIIEMHSVNGLEKNEVHLICVKWNASLILWLVMLRWFFIYKFFYYSINHPTVYGLMPFTGELALYILWYLLFGCCYQIASENRRKILFYSCTVEEEICCKLSFSIKNKAMFV